MTRAPETTTIPVVDSEVGAKLSIKKGVNRDLVFYALRSARAEPKADARSARNEGTRRCRFCGKPLLFLAAPILLVLVFAVRSQRPQKVTTYATLSGYAAVLEAQRLDQAHVIATLTIKPGAGLAAYILREKPLDPGSPVEVVFFSDDPAQLPVLREGQTPAKGSPDTVLDARLQPGPDATPYVRADVRIGDRTVTLTRPVDTAAAR